MTTVKEVKGGAKLPDPIYKENPYVILSDKSGIVLHAGTLESIRSITDYYDNCPADVRRYDLHLNDNTKVVEGQANTQAHTPTPKLEIDSGCVFIRLPDDNKRWFLFSTTGELIGTDGNSIGDLYWQDAPDGCKGVRENISAVVQTVNAYDANQALIAEQAADIARLRDALIDIRSTAQTLTGHSAFDDMKQCGLIADEALQAQEVAK